MIFHLKRIWEGKDLWEEIKSGRKTSEWRDFCKYWLYRLCKPRNPNILILYINVNGTAPQEVSPWLKVKKAWFLQGYPKGNLPRLEAEITGLVYHPDSSQLEIKFTNAKEVTEFRCSFPSHANCPSCSENDQKSCATPFNNGVIHDP